MSYKTQSHSLAEQINNLADVYSQVEVVPLAKAEIRRQARKGLPVTEGTDATTVVEVVDACAGVFGAQTVTPDPRSGSTRVGWWKDQPSSYSGRTLKHAFREAWARRKIRPQMSDEPTRIIRGRSSSEQVFSHTLSVSQASSDPRIVSCTLTITPVYADGSAPASFSGELVQSQFQQDSFGVDLTTSASYSGYPAASSDLVFEFEVNPTAAGLLDDSFDITTDSLALKFSLKIYSVEPAKDVLGAEKLSLGSISTYQDNIFVVVS